jgi:predicted nucleotidyltransferase
MAITNLNMGNLTLDVKTLNNILDMREKEKSMLHEELDKERDFQKGCKHNVEIRGRTWERMSRIIKCSFRNCKMRMRSSRVAQHD